MNWKSLLVLPLTTALLAGCAATDDVPTDDSNDGIDDVFLFDGKADTGGVVEGSPDALGVLKLVNAASKEILDVDAALDRRAAENIVYYRNGDDGSSGTGDDETFDTLAELDAIPYVGPSAFARLVEYARNNGYVSNGGAGDDDDDTTVVIGPPDLRGWIDVSLAGDQRPDWAPASAPKFGPNNALTYDNAVYHVYRGNTKIASADVGNRTFLPKGAYRVALNDTWTDVQVNASETVEVKAGRLEVEDVQGTFEVHVEKGDFSNGHQLLDVDAIPTGVGLNVLPGKYSISVKYQAHTKNFPVTIDAGEVEVVQPDDLRGHIVVEAPTGASLPSWQPGTAPKFGPSNRHSYDNDTYHVYAGNELLATQRLGEAFFGPEGTYTVALNDTKTTLRIEAGETTSLRASRLEVADVDGTFEVHVNAGDFSNGHQLLDTDDFPTGTGLNVMPGTYSVSVKYQAHTKNFTAQIQPGSTYLVQPDDLRGWVRVDPPTGATLPDWTPGSAPTFGPSNRHRYDNGVYHVYAGNTHLGTVSLGQPFFAPEGSYTVVVNDTKTTLNIRAGETAAVRAGRIEVNDVDGQYKIHAKSGDFSNGHQVLDVDDIPTGFGLNVMPGGYTVTVKYQTHTNNFDITIP